MLILSDELQVYFDPEQAAAATHDQDSKLLGALVACRLNIMRKKDLLRRKMRDCDDEAKYEDMKFEWETLKDEVNDIREISWMLQARLKAPV